MPLLHDNRLSLPVSASQDSSSWKPRTLSESLPMERRGPTTTKVKRWDGAARSCAAWDNLRRDPELWFRNGNCFVHLYGKGQSQRGPAFKVPFAALLSASCHPLLHRCIWRELPEVAGVGSDEFEDLDRWNQMNPNGRVDLYIPAPPTDDKTDAFNYHLATRNFFAWVFRRSLAGEHLGNALIALLNTMADFRSDDEDNVADLLDYMDEEGYLGVDSHPNHALAVLHFAEIHRLRDAYIHAFCHCAGMSEHLSASSEYHYITPASKRLIRRSRLEMDLKLSKAGKMLRTFLEDELSEPTITLPPGGRAHLERFRSFLFSFYSTKLGYYPPRTVAGRDSTFEPQIYQTLHEDFKALYEYLVDGSTAAGDDVSATVFGGVSVIQNILAFDSRRRFMTLDHPFPRLPEVSSSPTSKRQTWMSRGDKLSPDQRLIAHAALVRASNMKVEVLDNDLVRAYRKFEELMVAPATKVDRNEKIGLQDARKVRWILIYGMHQVLRNCSEIPPEVSDPDVDYHLSVSVDNLPPWKEQAPRETENGQAAWDQQSIPLSPKTIGSDIRPDIDYFAMIRRAEQKQDAAQKSQNSRSSISGSSTGAGRSLKSITHSSAVRRSMGLLKRSDAPPADTTPSRRSSMYQEIVVHGYGNGTNAVTTKPAPAARGLPAIDTAAAAATFRPVSTYSSSSYSSMYSDALSHQGSAGTADSSLPSFSPRNSKAEPSPVTQHTSTTPILSPMPIRSRQREVESMVSTSDSEASAGDTRPSTSSGDDKGAAKTEGNYAREYERLVQLERDRAELCPAPLQIRKTISRAHSYSTTPKGAYAGSVAESDDGLIWKCSGVGRTQGMTSATT